MDTETAYFRGNLVDDQLIMPAGACYYALNRQAADRDQKAMNKVLSGSMDASEFAGNASRSFLLDGLWARSVNKTVPGGQ